MNYSQHFITEYGYSGTRVILSELAPKRLKQFIEDVHLDLGYENYPHNWVMEILEVCFLEIEEPNEHNTLFMADTSLGLLYEWLTNTPTAAKYCDEVLSKASSKPFTLKSLLQMAQKEAISDIYCAVQIFNDE